MFVHKVVLMGERWEQLINTEAEMSKMREEVSCFAKFSKGGKSLALLLLRCYLQTVNRWF
jgi:hypothetical protein